MPTLKFIGHIHSPGVEVTIDFIPSIIWAAENTSKQWRFKTTIARSIGEVICDLDEYLPIQIGAIHARAHDLASACLDLGSFATGTPATLLFDEIVFPTGERKPLWIAEHDLAKLCTAYAVGNPSEEQRREFASMMNMVLGDYPLARAINDLTQTLHSQTQAAINCGRVLDGLRKIEAPEKSKIDGWAMLQKALNADVSYMNYITQRSVEPRHGDRSIPPLDQTDEIQTRTWSIMNRYLEYRKRGRQALDLIYFPLLQGELPLLDHHPPAASSIFIVSFIPTCF